MVATVNVSESEANELMNSSSSLVNNDVIGVTDQPRLLSECADVIPTTEELFQSKM